MMHLKHDEKAYRLLSFSESYPGLKFWREFERKLLIWRYPSFEPFSSWSLFEKKDNYWVRRIEWDRFLRFPSYDADLYTYSCEASIERSIYLKRFCQLVQVEASKLNLVIHLCDRYP